MTKMTYVAALSFAIDCIEQAINASGCADWDEEAWAVIEKLTALKAQTEKRNSTDRKPTKAQQANAELAEVVAEVLANSANPLTITEIMQSDSRFAGLSNQKVTAVVRAMGTRVEKVPDKRVNRFRLT